MKTERRSERTFRSSMFGVRCVVSFLLALFLSVCLRYASAQSPAQRGIGPFTLKAKRGTVTVRLLRRDRDLVWVMQQSRTGEFIETGIAAADIQAFDIPTPKLFLAADQAATPEQMNRVQAALRKFADQLMPFRDLPGMVLDEALLLQGRLHEKQERWAKAVAAYEDILAQDYHPPQAAEARLRAGLCYARLGQYEKALEYTSLENVTDDDLQLLSDVYFLRGEAFQHQGHYDEALLSYLYLVVFYPFVYDNEPRCLAAVLPCYAALTDWEAAYRTTEVLTSTYEGTEYAALAEAFAKEHETHIMKEVELQDTPDVTEFEEDKGVYEDFE